MRRRTILLLGGLAPVFQASAQNMVLTNGTMTIAPDTRIEVVGPITWELGVDAQVINHGEIDLGSEGVLDEALGAPVRGSGTERAVGLALPGGSPTEPGGLGLAITPPQQLGELIVTRGHTVSLNSEGEESIARWYRLESTAPLSGTAMVDAFYDLSELNGAEQSDLVLHGAQELSGPWSAAVSTWSGAQQTVSAPVSEWGYITLFEDPLTTVDAANGTGQWTLYPSVTNGPVLVEPGEGATIEDWTLFDRQGRMVSTMRNAMEGGRLVLDLSPQPAGLYLLRINGHHTFRVVKE